MERVFEAFRLAGFSRFRRENVDFPFDGSFHAWIGLNAALFPNALEIHPNIGVHALEIEKLIARLTCRKYSRSTPTYAITLGELGGVASEPAFAFAPDQSEGFIFEEIDRLVHLYSRFGLPYALSIANYEALSSLLEARIPLLGGYPESYTCCLYLMDRKQEAYDFCSEFSSSNKPSFWQFSENFLELVRGEFN